MNMKKWLLLLLLPVIPLIGAAQDISLTADYPHVVSSGEQFAVSIIINGSGGELTPPSFSVFSNVMGPQTSYSSSTQIINGKFTSTTTNTYIYYMVADRKGKFVLSPAILKVKGKEYRSDSLRIEVVAGTVNTQPVQGTSQGTQQAADQGGPSGSDLYIRLIINKSEVYQGESLTATLKIYSRVDLSGLNEIKFPDFNGFMRENLETPPLTSLQRENINGVIYNTGVIQQFLLFPQMSGEITIGPVEISALVQQKTKNSDPFFGDFFSSYQNVPKLISTRPVKISVKALPANKPSDFSGLVGKIDLKATVSRDSVNVNDALNYKIVLSGSGNLKLAGKPSFKMPPDVEVYEPKITDNIKNSISGTSGQKTFEYVLIPRHYGSYTIPALSYTYFDPDTKRYENLSTREYTFYARKGSDQGGGVTVYGGVSKEDVKYLGKDIRFIDINSGSLAKPENLFISNNAFLTLYGIAFVIFLAVLIIRREHIRRNADLSSVRNRKAGRVAVKRLEEASKCLKEGLTDKFHEEILKALWGYLSDKLSISVSELTRSTAVDALRTRSVAEDQITALEVILDKCEYARFAPVSSESDAGIYEGALQFIKFVENEL
jgi:hypothetical protein